MIRNAQYRSSSATLGNLPNDGRREIALIGRSNVGKSSLINMLCGHKGLAKVSSTPGKTKVINHFLINGEWYLVDLPGYGYARTSKGVQRGFARIITDYVFNGETMHFLFVLVDARLKPQAIDLEFISALGQREVPFGLIFTKCDKQSRAATERSVHAYREELAKTWEEIPPIFLSSSSTGLGKDEIVEYIESII